MEKHWWWLGAFIVVGLLLGLGILFLITRPPQGSAISLLPAPTKAPITVYVSGSVNQVGLYALPPGSRVNDAIQAAGGFSADANSSFLNLAEVLEDGEQIDVPDVLSSSAQAGTVNPGGANNATDPGSNVPGLVNINIATLADLDTLPGIGPITAQDILDYRSVNGQFAKIEDIMNVSGIGQTKFDRIKDLITVGKSP